MSELFRGRNSAREKWRKFNIDKTQITGASEAFRLVRLWAQFSSEIACLFVAWIVLLTCSLPLESRPTTRQWCGCDNLMFMLHKERSILFVPRTLLQSVDLLYVCNARFCEVCLWLSFFMVDLALPMGHFRVLHEFHYAWRKNEDCRYELLRFFLVRLKQ